MYEEVTSNFQHLIDIISSREDSPKPPKSHERGHIPCLFTVICMYVFPSLRAKGNFLFHQNFKQPQINYKTQAFPGLLAA